LTAAGKNGQKTVTALGRELLGFVWAIGVKVESNPERTDAAGRVIKNQSYEIVPWRITIMMRTERVAIEEPTERRIPENAMRQAFGQTRAISPRQLPTDHDYAASTREYQSDQPSQKLLDRPLALSSQNHDQRKPRKTSGNPRLFLLASVFQNGARRQGLASPRPHRAPLTAPRRSKLRCLRRNGTKRKNQIVRFST
jgi:hypothetical protein